jgi:two-component system sensor histidine kinase ChvG
VTQPGALARFSRSIKVQLAALVLVFVVPPLLLYSVFRSAEQEKQELLMEAVRENGHLVGRAIEPFLQALQPSDFPVIQDELARFESPQRSIKVLFSPAGSNGFFYVASAPAVPFSDLDQERQRLMELGILDRLAGSCTGNVPLGERVTMPNGEGEVLTSVTPVQSDRGCWAVVVAARTDTVADLIDGRAYWTRPEAQMAAVVYATMAVLVFLIFGAVWSALARFRRTAARVEEGQSFATTTAVPELEQVGREFDGMVARLKRATDVLRQAAEDNAHAFKGPIAVIRQAVELVGKKVNGDRDAALGVGAIAVSLDRLEGLVRSAQRLDTATADLLETGWSTVDLSSLVEAFADDYRLMLGVRQEILKVKVEPGIAVQGRDDVIETILENLVDNAVSFSPPEGTVRVALEADDGVALLTVEDNGVGVDPSHLPRIFERYYSSRPPVNGRDPNAPAEMHFGIGLWLVRQHVLALGGSVAAENRKGGGLRVTVRLPIEDASLAPPHGEQAWSDQVTGGR